MTTIEKVKNTQGVDKSSEAGSGLGGFSFIDNDMTMNGSIFNKVQGDNKANPADAQAKLSEAGPKNNSAKGMTAACKEIASNTKGIIAKGTNALKQFVAGTKNASNKIKSEDKKIHQLNKENQQTNNEIENLIQERDSGADTTGSGKQSAFSLTLAGSNSNNANTANNSNTGNANSNNNSANNAGTQTNADSADSGKKDELNTQIESKSAKITANNSSIKQATKVENSTKKGIDNLFKSASAIKKQTNTQLAQNAKTSDTAATIATTTQATGGATSATGQIFTTTGNANVAAGVSANAAAPGSGAPLIAKGAGEIGTGGTLTTTGTGLTATGTVTQAASALSKNDTQGAIAATGKAFEGIANTYSGFKATNAAKTEALNKGIKK